MSRSRDFLLLLTYGLAAGACGAAVDPAGEPTAGNDHDDLEAAIEVCGPWAQKYIACYSELYGGSEGYSYGYVAFVGQCISYVGYGLSQGPGCGDAISDYYACLGALDCEALLGGDGAEQDDDPCAAESEVADAMCDRGDVDSNDSSFDSGDIEPGDEGSSDSGEAESTTSGGTDGGVSSSG